MGVAGKALDVAKKRVQVNRDGLNFLSLAGDFLPKLKK